MAMVFLTRPAHGARSADPVQVRATVALCPAVSAVDDGHAGALVFWQENADSGGSLRGQHILPNGDLDPAWGAPVALTTESAARAAVASTRRAR